MNKIFPKEYNCFYCKCKITKEMVTKVLKKDGQGATKLFICKECNNKVK